MEKNQRFEIDSRRLWDWVNMITEIYNAAVKGDMFVVGFNLSFLQQCISDCLKNLEKQKIEDLHD